VRAYEITIELVEREVTSLGELNLTVEDEVRWAGEGDLGESLVGAWLEADGEGFSTFDIDLNRGRSSGVKVVNEGAGGDAGPASEGFVLNSALVGADGEVIGGKSADEVGVGAIGLEMIVVANGGSVFDNVAVGEVIDKNDGVRNACVEIVDGCKGGDWRVELEADGVRHVDADFFANEFRLEGAGDGLEGEGCTVAAEKSGGVAAKTTGAITAHFRFAAVGIIVTEFDISIAFGRFDCDVAIRSDAAVAIAEEGDLGGGEVGVERAVINHDEVVSGSVHFGESESHGSKLSEWLR